MRWLLRSLVWGTLLGPLAPGPGQAAPPIIDRPVRFDAERTALTLQYIAMHYGLKVQAPTIVPRAIVVHWTATRSLQHTWRGFDRVRLSASRRHLLRGGALNVSAHFLVDRDGTIYRLLPETIMARHCIGLNYDAIGIENMGGTPGQPLTRAQLLANAQLVRYLAGRHPIRYLVGHMEWKSFQRLPIFRERDPTYRNAKADPGKGFLTALRQRVADLHLLDSRGK